MVHMVTTTTVATRDRVGAGFGVLMLLEAASLAVMSTLHLTGTLDGGRPPYQPGDAGIAEAIIAVVLLAAAIGVLRSPHTTRSVAIGATAFAVLGFAIGITITARGGDVFDVAYHASVLPILVVSLVLLVVRRPRGRE
jgi:hypothetical protein